MMRSLESLLLGLVVIAPQLAHAVDSLVDLGYARLQGGAAQASGVTQWLGVRYAAAPVGNLRFAAPIDPPAAVGVVDATKFRAICLSSSPSDFTNNPGQRFTVGEDCLFANIFAPSNATQESRLPVMYFIQGGGFTSNSNADFHCGDIANFGNIVVVQINYRVGPFGFLQSREVLAAGSLNNGLKDMIQGMKWVKQHIASFGGDPDHIVATGDSAGAIAIGLLMAAWADNDPGFIKGAIMESTSVATLRTLDQGQEQYSCLLNATGCSRSINTLNCLQRLNASALQTPNCQFNPGFDGNLVKIPMLQAFDEGRYLKIPNIAGTCNDEGTKATPMLTNTTEDALKFVRGQTSGTLTAESLSLVNETYLAAPQPVFPDAGPLWRQVANAHGDFRAHCITARLQNAMARDGVKTFNYRYAVLDPEQEELGFGAYHVVELNGVFGPNNTDGFPPKSYATTNAAIVPITMAYWTSFVKSLDPNNLKMDGMPEWTAWSGTTGRQRMRFQTDNMGMETMNETQTANCEMFDPMLPNIELIMNTSTVVALNEPGEVNGTSWEDGFEGTARANTLATTFSAAASSLRSGSVAILSVVGVVLASVFL